MKKLLTTLILAIFLISSVSAFMPATTHKLIHQQGVENPINSEMYRACTNHPKLCYVGNVLTDISVYFYYTARSKYSSTHSPSFVRSLIEHADTDEELACAGGSGIHQASDIVSHNEMVPESIIKSKLVNNVVHVFAEQKLDNWVRKKYPGLREEVNVDLNDYNKCVPLFIETMLGEPQYSDMTRGELEDMFSKFIAEIQNSQTGYDTAFKAKSFFVNLSAIPFALLASFFLAVIGFLLITILLVMKLIKGDRRARIWTGTVIFGFLFLILGYVFVGNLYGSAFNNFIILISPASELVPIGDEQHYIDKAVSNTKAFLTQGEQWLYNTEASGFTALDEADSQVLLFDYILLFILAIAMIWFIWYLFKQNKVKALGGL
ncbi:MAG: zinc dependent phospholipase C family protein [Nanoarchaeota archaeon]|nr:zinc dependent phospholipase C family protein [Nanoarchaeota archaeon]